MFTFNNAEYKVVARTTNDFGEVAEIAVNNNGELALRKFTYNSVGEPNNCITESRANNYWCTVNEMSEEDFQKVKSFYIDFVNETLPRLLK